MASTNTVAFTGSLASATALVSQNFTLLHTLVPRVYVPLIGNEPSNDPVVWVGIGILIFMIALALFLLTWTQWRSAKQVWKSVESKGQWKHLRNSTVFVTDTERSSSASSEMEAGQVRISHRIPMDDSDFGYKVGSDAGFDFDFDDAEIDAGQGDALLGVPGPGKSVRLSDPIPRTLPRTSPSSRSESFDAVYDRFKADRASDSEDSDLGIAANHRKTMSGRQLRELYLGGN